MTLYPSIDDVLAAHARLIATFGGAEGVRDRAALEAAVARPQTGYYQDVVEQAAALLESLAQNQPFIDGNKRTAIAVTAAFLHVNGYRLEFEDLETYAFMMALFERGNSDSRNLSLGFESTRVAPCKLCPAIAWYIPIQEKFQPL